MLLDLPWSVSLVLIFGALLALFAIGVPIGFAMIAVAIFGMAYSAGWDQVLDTAPAFTIYHQATPYIFICIPMFVLMTEFMSHGGISATLVEICERWIGRIPGSLAVVTIAASTVFGAMCSSTVIGAMVMSEMVFPEAEKRNYDKSLMAGTIAAGGTLSVLIPPSGTFILYSIITQAPLKDLFIAGIIPGTIAAIVFCVYVVGMVKRNPSLAPMLPAATWKERLKVLLKGWDIVLLIFVVLGGIYFGVATVTQMSAVGAFTALVIGIVRRTLNLQNIYIALRRSAELVGAFIVLLFGAFLLKNFITYMEIPYNLSEWVVDMELSETVLIIAIVAIFFIMGCFIDAASVILIVMPLFLPILEKMEVDLVWLGVIITINAMIATLTPPVGMNLFVIQTVGRRFGISFYNVIRGSSPYIVLLFIVMIILWVFPPLVTWLPERMG